MTYEQQLLGALIKTPVIFKELSLELKVGDFAIESHKNIYKTMVEMVRDGEWLDFVSLNEKIGNKEIQNEITYLVNSSQELDLDQLKLLVNKVRDESVKYRLKQVGGLLTEDSTYKVSTKEVLNTAAKRLFDIGEEHQNTELSPEDIISQMDEERRMFSGKDMWGYHTGFTQLDSATRGIQKGQLWVVGAYTSVGKSWFCLNFANEAHKDGAKVLFLSAEMIEKRIAWRYVSLNTKLNEYDMISGSLSPESEERMNAAINRLRDGSFQLQRVSDLDEIVFLVKREVIKENCDVVVVDFLQNLAVGRDEYEELSKAIRRLQILALSENIAVIVASQVNRESNKSKLGGTFGYKGSGAIEAAADVGIVLKTDSDDKDSIILSLKKNRNGYVKTFKVNVKYARGIMEEVTGDVDDE